MTKKFILESAAALMILLFLYTGMDKLWYHEAFLWSLTKSPLLWRYALPVSLGIPVLEIFTAILLIFPAFRPYGFALSAALMLAFTFYVGYLIFFVPQLPCSCGGVVSGLTWGQHLLFNFIFLVLSATGLVLSLVKKRN